MEHQSPAQPPVASPKVPLGKVALDEDAADVEAPVVAEGATDPEVTETIGPHPPLSEGALPR